MTRGILSLFFIIVVILLSACSSQTPPQVPSETPIPTSSVPKNKAYSITWEDNVQITNTSAAAIYPTLGISGNIIHLAWVDQRNGGENREIYYNRSIDNGLTWQTSDTRISDNPLLSIKADLAVKGNSVNLFWRDTRDGNF